MSIVSDRHQFVEFISGESKPMMDQRLAKVGYKAKSGKKSQCVSIPKLSDADVNAIHTAFPIDVRKRVEDMQDSLIRALLESGKSEITSSEIAADQIRAFIDATSASDRLSGELIGKWFDGFSETALAVLSEKYATDDSKILEKKMNVWKDAFIAIAGRSMITKERIVQLQSMLEYTDEDDSMATRIASKLEGMMKELDTMDAL